LTKPSINIVWFKRDLRLQDHLPLQKAVKDGLPVLLVYFFEPSVMQNADSDIRHWRFVQESLVDLNTQLDKFNNHIYTVQEEVLPAMKTLLEHYEIQKVYSHEETGNDLTYKRDIEIGKFLSLNNVRWIECPTNGIIRKLKDRRDFTKKWFDTMSSEIFEVNLSDLISVKLKEDVLKIYELPCPRHVSFQPGGTNAANRYLQSFLYERGKDYNKYISKPELSRKSCSRLSPYLAWGNLSMKQVYQSTVKAIAETGNKRNLRSFTNRLLWHCHFIQKFENECRMEFENLNVGFDDVRKEVNHYFTKAWEEGKTGYPLVDACMRCVVQTGYLNFRMRSMIVSFLTHHLWQPWQAGASFLARQFLDYEPGIHYPQFQMQAGTTGVNTIRIYNPIKQSIDNDPDGVFIKKYLPELKHVPTAHIHEPWLLTAAEQLMYKVQIGTDYPAPIIDIIATGKYARQILWSTKASKKVKQENKRILKVHTKRKTEKEAPLTLNFEDSTS
jgi:deoxyribodipyrimidine photo-lyase